MSRSSFHPLVRLIVFSVVLLAGSAAFGQGVFVETDGFATKTGFRGVFVWKATQPGVGGVHYGVGPTAPAGVATKPGFRAVFVWKATQPVMGVVHYGLSPTALDQTVSAVPGLADTS